MAGETTLKKTNATQSDLDRPAILGLGATGAVPATLALFGLYPAPVEFLLWTVLAAAVWIPVSIRRGIRRRFVHMLLVGLVAGVVTGIIQAAFAHVLFANVPVQAEQFGGTATLVVRMQIFLIDVAIGVVWGLLVGAVWAAVAHLSRTRSAKEAAE